MDNCDHYSTSYAFIIDKDADKMTVKDKTYIDHYLDSKALRDMVKSGQKIIRCKTGMF